MNLIDQIDKKNIPQHVAFIMDGNGRWAKKQGKDRLEGHLKGADSIRSTLKAAKEIGIKFVTYYAFSTENWNRPQEEVNGIMDLLVYVLGNEVPELKKSGVRLVSIGAIDQLPTASREKLEWGIEETKENTAITLVIALNYSGRSELVKATKEIALKVQSGTLKATDINEQTIQNELYTSLIPDPELLIRTSGELRISNFLLWQIAYTEFYFTPTFWPEFDGTELYKAIVKYQTRERRFGMVSEQL